MVWLHRQAIHPFVQNHHVRRSSGNPLAERDILPFEASCSRHFDFGGAAKAPVEPHTRENVILLAAQQELRLPET